VTQCTYNNDRDDMMCLQLHVLLSIMLHMQAQKKRRETWAGGALSSYNEDSDDDMTQDLLPFRAHSRHTGL